MTVAGHPRTGSGNVGAQSARSCDADGQVVARASAGLTVPIRATDGSSRIRARSGGASSTQWHRLDSAWLARVSAIGISNQRESVVLWERTTGLPLGPCVSWQCSRGAALCARLHSSENDELVRARTGLPLDPAFSASKAAWLLRSDPSFTARAAAGELCLGTVDSWLVWNLTAGRVHATDVSNAARTLLFDIHSLAWDDDLLELFDVPRAALPQVLPSAAHYGFAEALPGSPPAVRITALIGDSPAAMLALGSTRPGIVKATYGTGTSIMTPVAAPVGVEKLALSVAWQAERVLYALEGNILSTGGTIQWLADLLGLSDGVSGVARLAASVSDAGGVVLVPAFSGLGAPHWQPHARGLLSGLSLGSGAAEIAPCCTRVDRLSSARRHRSARSGARRTGRRVARERRCDCERGIDATPSRSSRPSAPV